MVAYFSLPAVPLAIHPDLAGALLDPLSRLAGFTGFRYGSTVLQGFQNNKCRVRKSLFLFLTKS
jgi:hypothetical protein